MVFLLQLLFITITTLLLSNVRGYSLNNVNLQQKSKQILLSNYVLPLSYHSTMQQQRNSLTAQYLGNNRNNDYDNEDDNRKSNNPLNSISNSWNNFWSELDNFMDDASARRLGNGAAFYGKRKSNFYGKDDKNKKQLSTIADPTEDYQAPNTGGYFQWMRDDDGQMRPVSRLKKQNIERNPKFWDKFYEKQDQQDE